ncbi:adenosylmethionine decarboxylase [Chromobacterium sp. IIBBL 290-4]|uniref:adenosylmethionine decarboxylase n=1 Tax=Chromobacterium sp. IIBBL 290-4 TaxID=2953890 RepID=UPI0020B898C2|nr:adenosylmethionine decarboxylase [Chromobacterium sp. IIBBL 290-4]UTH75964.1 adenosylmethionine decarboxylase [Chromobacterium sp. IIBBL 290-4]
MTKALGRHLLADFHDCPPAALADPAAVEAALREAARLAGATVLAGHVHHFGDGQGVTGILLLMESHLSIHTWPEHGYAALDLFMCGEPQLETALAHLAAALRPGRRETRLVERGRLP